MNATTTRLSSQDWAILERRVRMAGGLIEGEKCEGTVVEGAGESGSYRTCACGEHRRVRVPYAPLGVEEAELAGEVILCANCDGLARTPRFAYTRAAE